MMRNYFSTLIIVKEAYQHLYDMVGQNLATVVRNLSSEEKEKINNDLANN